MAHTITLIPGDGVGPEVTAATRKIIDATGLQVNWEVCEAGAEVFKKGLSTGVPKETIDSIIQNRVALKGPLSTPVGFGEKSANVTLRKLFEAYGNIRPIREIPGIITPYTGRNIDFVIVRENLEDLYAGIEYMQTPGVSECLKIISRKGSEKVIRLAFELARSEGRKSVHCATKANIMKLSEGMFKRTFEDVAKDYPDIRPEHVIIDNAAHQLVKKPEQFEVIVTTNMNGDILSDLSSALIGGLGFAPGANIGDDYAIFEAVHGTAPKYAGQNNINPTAVLMSGIMMLRYLKEFEKADIIEQALYTTLAVDGLQTRDTKPNDATSTSDFANAIIKNFGKTYDEATKRSYKAIDLPKVSKEPDFVKATSRSLAGIDIFIETALEPNMVGNKLTEITTSSKFSLKMLSSRGVKLYPGAAGAAFDGVDMMTARLSCNDPSTVTDQDILDVLALISQDFKWAHVEKLQVFDGVLGYTKAHGED